MKTVTNKDKTKGVTSIILEKKEINNPDKEPVQFIPNPRGVLLRLASKEQLELYYQLAYGESQIL